MTSYDIVLYGATGFTGRLVAACLATHPDRNAFSWAIAGRNPTRLAELRAVLAADHGADPGIIVAETAVPRSVDELVSRARVVLTTAGPYSVYHGRTLVASCVKAGCDYADISGEYWFQREMIDAFHCEAQRTGARIVLAAGVDSIPSDLGAQFAIERLEATGAPAARVKALYTDFAGAFSGGTSRTRQELERRLQSGHERSLHRDPYALAPEHGIQREAESVTGWDRLRFDTDFRTFGGPFFMAPVNARIVRRTLALTGRLPCSYAEGISLAAGLKTLWLWASRGFGLFVGQPIPLRPKPGQGPPAWLREAGSFRVLIKAAASTGRPWVMVEVKGQGDPGYAATSRMLAETGLCLRFDRERLPATGGVLTPAAALGRVLRERLMSVRDGEFMQFRVVKAKRAG
jgi:short subunit dehydrogenase-like uncharacterized protein